MSNSSKEAYIIFILKTSHENPKLNYRAIAQSFRVSKTTLRQRENGHLFLSERQLAMQKLIDLEEKVILKRILNLDSQGFTPQLTSVEDIANFILKS
jgi:hypothetical protein